MKNNIQLSLYLLRPTNIVYMHTPTTHCIPLLTPVPSSVRPPYKSFQPLYPPSTSCIPILPLVSPFYLLYPHSTSCIPILLLVSNILIQHSFDTFCFFPLYHTYTAPISHIYLADTPPIPHYIPYTLTSLYPLPALKECHRATESED